MAHCNVTHEKVYFGNNSNKWWCYTSFDRKEKRTVKEYKVKEKNILFFHI